MESAYGVGVQCGNQELRKKLCWYHKLAQGEIKIKIRIKRGIKCAIVAHERRVIGAVITPKEAQLAGLVGV